MPRRPLLLLPLALAGCATDGPETRVATQRPPSRAPAGIERAMGQDAATLIARFGPPALDVREGPARKLQFRGPACTLDAYLYPPSAGGEPRATWLDARDPQGGDFDRASCVAALARR